MVEIKIKEAPTSTFSSSWFILNRLLKSSKMSGTFPEILRRTRDDKGLSQSDLAEKAGMQPSAISHFEAGRRSPSFDNLKRLADALNVTIDFLLGREKEAKPAGPVAEQLFRDFEKLSAQDQETLSSFAKVLAAKNKGRSKED